MGILERLRQGLKKTRDNLKEKVDSVIASFTKIDEDLFEELEEILVLADIGVEASLEICSHIRNSVKREGITDPAAIKDLLGRELEERLSKYPDTDLRCISGPSELDIILIVGVNGTGKTTSAGKIASFLKDNDKKVIIAAADTFRAAAIEQLELWAERAGAGIIKHKHGADPGAVVFDSIRAARSRNADVLIIDTAGRLHTKKKQAKAFGEATGIDGIILTKMDGTAKGGIIIPITSELGVPVKFVGIGEKTEDLKHFDPTEFSKALL